MSAVPSGFTETDPANGAVWVGVDRSVLVFDATGKPAKTLVGKGLARDAAFDTESGRGRSPGSAGRSRPW